MKYVYVLIICRFGLALADCGSLPVIEDTSNNATGSGPYATGTAVKFECNLGFNPYGNSKIYICSGNTWTNGDMRCEKMYCSHVETPENGRVVNAPNNEVGSSINFECNNGYDMKGNKQMLCRTDGEWLPKQPPTCQIKMCGDFGSIQHATTFQDSSVTERDGYGSVVRVYCKSGFILNGPPNVMCQADGTWEKRPTCVENNCSPYPGMNSSCIYNSQIMGSFLFMKCKEDVPVTKTGPDGVECIEGKWENTDEVMACYCNCKVITDLTLVRLNNANDGYLGHKGTLDWSCKKGSKKSDTAPLTCNDGNILRPVCKSSKPPTKAPVTDKDKDGSTVSQPSTKSPERETGLNIGMVIGIIVGVVAVAISAVIGFLFYKKKRKNCPGKCNGKGDKLDKVDEKEKVRLTNKTDGVQV